MLLRLKEEDLLNIINNTVTESINHINKELNENVKTLTESYLSNKIGENLKKELNEFINEHGIDYDKLNKTVAFNPNHQEGVNTNDPWNPKPIYNEVDGYKIISIFEREKTDDRQDGNPLIYALKGKYSWVFKNPSYDYFSLLRRFVAVCKELNEEYDVIITTPSSNSLNTEILHRIIKLIPHNIHFERFFCKYNAQDVYDITMDSMLFNKYFEGKELENAIYNFEMAIERMNVENNGVFSYKYLPSYLRPILSNSMYVNKDVLNDEKVNELINGKKILVIDDTVTSGKTISDSADALKSVFNPQSITFLTLFSPLKN